MGLDIRAYSNLVLEGVRDEYNEAWDSLPLLAEYVNPDFPHAVPADWKGGQFAVFSKTDDTIRHSFCAGSYGGYNEFRRSLALGTSVWAIWEDPEAHADKPFVEMINFSDCEGVMHGPVCEKLYNDFVNNAEAYKDYVLDMYDAGIVARFLDKYEDWTEAYRLGSLNGLVCFK